jgi:peroxin-1
VDRAIHSAAVRSLSLQSSQQSVAIENCKKPELIGEDFSKALENFLPAAMRGIAKSSSQGGRLGWEDVGGLFETRTAIKEVSFKPYYFTRKLLVIELFCMPLLVMKHTEKQKCSDI